MRFKIIDFKPYFIFDDEDEAYGFYNRIPRSLRRFFFFQCVGGYYNAVTLRY
jgi:hypothetical protein